MSLAYTPELTASMNVKDIGKSIAWYQEVLGFELLFHAEEIGWCELSTSVPGVSVGLSENQQVPSGGNAINVWGVQDINAAKAHLDHHGVKQDGEIQEVPGMVKLLTFYDPDGNAMMLAETLSAEG